jgi:hypothetical protein
MTRAEFQALFPEFSASTYNDRIDALLPVVPELDHRESGDAPELHPGSVVGGFAHRAGHQDQIRRCGPDVFELLVDREEGRRGLDQDGHLAVSRKFEQFTGARPGQTTYGVRYVDEVRQLGVGAVAV